MAIKRQCPVIRFQCSDTKLTTDRRSPFTVKAFTLIELLVATSILGLIGLTILTTFGSGFAVYERVQSYGGVQADALLALEEMETRLRNTLPFSPIKFEGEAQRISFPAVIEENEIIDGEDTAISSIGEVAYYLDNADNEAKTLVGRQQRYAQAISKDEAQGYPGTVLASVKNLKFSYYSFDDEGKTYNWADSWSTENENLPTAVKIEMIFQDGNRDIPLVRTVMIPSVRVAEEKAEIKDEDEGEEGEG